MTTPQQLITEAANQSDIRVSDYSGRGMFGRYCMSISGNMRECMQVISLAIVNAHNMIINEDEGSRDLGNFDQLVNTLLSFDQDSMGYGVVLYWQGIEYVEDEEYEDDGEE